MREVRNKKYRLDTDTWIMLRQTYVSFSDSGTFLFLIKFLSFFDKSILTNGIKCGML